MARISSGRNKKKILQASQSKSDSVKKVYNNATTFFQKGMRKEAEQICRQILSANPAHSDALHLLGAIRYQDGSINEAVDLIRQAIVVCNLKHHYHNSLGLALQSLGRIEDAIECFNQSLLLKPANAGGWYNLGIALDRIGKSDAAVACYHKALTLRPNDAALLNGIGEAFKFHDLLEEAYACFEISLKLDSANANTMNSLGTVLKMLNRYEQALKWFEKAIQIQPESADFHNNLGVVLKNMGQPERASECYRKAIEINPANHYALYNLAIELRDQNLYDEALAMANQSLQICSDYAQAHDFLGILHMDMGNIKKSQQAFLKALELDPTMSSTRSNLLLCLNCDPDLSCNQLFIMYQNLLREPPKAVEPIAEYPNTKDKHRRIKIGYLSPDFIWSSFAFFLYPLLAAHDISTIDVFCYSDVPAEDDMTARFRNLAHTWRSVSSLTDLSLEEQIRKDQIDILVDMSGHTSRNRWTVLARKPAPIQMTYLGYPNTIGLKTIDYRITDEWADPSGESDQWHSEKLIRLPRSFLSYQPLPDAPDITALPANLNGFVTFGSFNNRSNINENVVSLWSKILRAVPGSRLLLKDKVFASEIGRIGIYLLFEKQGINLDCITLLSFAPGVMNYLTPYADIDIAMDTFPCNGTTTTCEALWMGVPVVALSGDRHTSRVSASILNALGMNSWIAQTPQEYFDIAVALAMNLPALKNLRSRLREMMMKSAILDAKGLSRTIENIYRDLWHEWCCKKIDLGVLIKGQVAPVPEEPLFINLRDDKLPEQVIENLRPVTDHVDRAAAELLNQQGEALAASGLQDEAMDHFQKAVARCPDWVVPFNNIGVVYWQSGNKAAAIKWMTKAYRIDPDHWETVQNLAEMLVQIDRSDSAFLVTQSYLQKHPENREIQNLSNNLRPPIRIIHHMARSGGTILCKCLGCMNRILLLSEVHPLGMKWFDPLIQAYEWFDLFTGEEMDVMKRANLTFQQKVTRIYERSVSQNRQLVLRDWSHLDFTGVPFVKNPSYSLITATVLQDRFHVIHLATVRHPIDQWLSLSRLAVMNNQITIDAFLYGYHRFAEFARNIGFIRYEDFTQNPQSTMQTICKKISLDYDDTFLNNWTNYTTITGDTRSERGPDACIRTMPRRPVEKGLLKQFASSPDYWNSLSILGYDHQE